MSNQEIFEMLSENECKLYYALARADKESPLYEALGMAHKAARNALETFAKETGCHN